VRLEAPQEADWLLLISLWAAYNRYLAHVIAHVPASKLGTQCRIDSRNPVPPSLSGRGLLNAYGSSSFPDWRDQPGLSTAFPRTAFRFTA
jgi:hypothetical protein